MVVKKEIDGSWSYRFYSNGKDYRKKGFATKRDCLDAENKKRLEIKGFIENTTNIQTLYEMFINKRKNKVKIATLKKDETTLKKYVLNKFTSTNQLNTYTIDKWKNEIVALGYKEHYTNQVIKIFRSFLNYCKNYTYIDPRCIDELDIVKLYEIKEEMKIWSVDEFNKFISAIDNEYYKTLFTTLFWSGLRISELRALTPQDIQGDYLIINKRLDSKYTKTFTTLKTANSQRKVLMPNWIIEQLKQLKGDLLFPTSETQLRRKLNEYIKKSNTTPIHIHSFRHSHASFLIRSGMSITIVSERLGHSDPSITMKYYSHLLPNDQQLVLDLIEKEKKV